MDFQSLTNGNTFYVLRRCSDKPILEVGTVKSKSQPRANYQTQTPNLMAGMQMQQVLDIIVTINGKDENFPNLPLNVEIASRGNDTFSGSREAMLQAVDTMLQASKKALEDVPYHKIVISESEKMIEVLNPRYAEEKKQARTISELEQRQKLTDDKLTEVLNILRELNGTPGEK